MTPFDKNKLGSIDLNNRFIRSALWTKMADTNGNFTQQVYDLYDEVSKGGVALIITGYQYIDPIDRPNPGMIGIDNDNKIEGHKKLTDLVHKNGSKIVSQIVYGGSQSGYGYPKDTNIYGPSEVKNRVSGITPIQMSQDDINRTVKQFSQAAMRAKEAGYDGVQIHAAHGYLLSQFLSPFYNRRTDKYGGDIHNRARFIYETIDSIKKAVGEEYPVLIKINHDDFMDEGEGMTFEEAKEIISVIDKMGLTAIEISGGNESSGKRLGPARKGVNSIDKEAYFYQKTKEIALNTQTPVILMGGLRSMDKITEIANEGIIKYFSLARPLLAEPNLINIWKKNKDYRSKCISCNKCHTSGNVECIFNKPKAG